MPNVYLSEEAKDKLDELQEVLGEDSVGTVKKTDVVEEALEVYEAEMTRGNA